MSRYYKATEVDEFLNIGGKGNCNLCAFYDDCNSRGLNRKGSHRYCWQAMRFTTADVTEVVRCKDCKFFQDRYVIVLLDGSKRPYKKGEDIVPLSGGINVGSYCKRIDYAIVHGYRNGEPSVDETRLWTNPDDFCSYGERKDEK